MKSAVYALAVAAVAFAVTTDDVKWINQCVNDNKGGAAQTWAEILHLHVREDAQQRMPVDHPVGKTHATERKACDKEAGWK